MHSEKLFYFNLKPGMKTSQDVFSADGKLIITAGTILTPQIISKLSYNNIIEVNIAIEDDTPQEEPHLINNASYSQKIKNSEEFKEFKKDYLNNVTEIKGMFNDIVNKNKAIDSQALIEGSVSLIGESYNGIHIFDMLHNMRDFDDSTHIHSVNVGLIAGIIGKWLNYDKQDIDSLILCGILHDIGKLTVPYEILTKPARLTRDEFLIMKQHPVNGYNLIKEQDIDARVKEACLLHHERCDGSGYPFGLMGNKIPLFAKIISIADVYDAMTADRCYRSGLCPFDVIKMFEEDGLHHYDPLVILTFLENIVQTYMHNTVRLSDGTVGEIVLINKLNFTKPVICSNNTFIDLSKFPDLKIEAIL